MWMEPILQMLPSFSLSGDQSRSFSLALAFILCRCMKACCIITIAIIESGGVFAPR